MIVKIIYNIINGKDHQESSLVARISNQGGLNIFAKMYNTSNATSSYLRFQPFKLMYVDK